MKSEIVFVGQAPSKDTVKGEAFSGRSGQTLANLLRMPKAVFLSKVRRINLVDSYPGKKGKGDAFPLPTARMKALLLTERYIRKRALFVFVGKNVAKAFSIKGEYFESGVVAGRLRWTLMPHPSGINRWWNEPENRRKAARAFNNIRRKL